MLYLSNIKPLQSCSCSSNLYSAPSISTLLFQSRLCSSNLVSALLISSLLFQPRLCSSNLILSKSIKILHSRTGPSKILFFQPLALDLHNAAIHQTTHFSLLHSSKLKAILQDSALEQLLCQCVPTHSFSAPHCICQNFESSGKHCHSLSFKLPQNTAHQTQISL